MRLEYFQNIDRVDAIDLSEGLIQATALVPETSTVFEGHFPGYPIVPGVLLIETMAQACGFLILARLAYARMAFLAQVKVAKLRQFVGPSTALSVTGRLVHEGQGYAVAEGSISTADNPIAEAELRFRTMTFPNEELRSRMLERAREVGLTPADPA